MASHMDPKAAEYSANALNYVDSSVKNGQLDRNYIWKDPEQYVTTYQQLCSKKEKDYKSDFPSGYGGHKPECRGSVLYKSLDKNSPQYGELNESRDYIPPFNQVIAGVPSITSNPKSKHDNPKFGTIPLLNQLIVPPYATTKPLNNPPCHRNAAYTHSNYLAGLSYEKKKEQIQYPVEHLRAESPYPLEGKPAIESYNNLYLTEKKTKQINNCHTAKDNVYVSNPTKNNTCYTEKNPDNCIDDKKINNCDIKHNNNTNTIDLLQNNYHNTDYNVTYSDVNKTSRFPNKSQLNTMISNYTSSFILCDKKE